MMTKLGVHILPMAFPWTLAMIRKVATILGPVALASLIRIAQLVYELWPIGLGRYARHALGIIPGETYREPQASSGKPQAASW